MKRIFKSILPLVVTVYVCAVTLLIFLTDSDSWQWYNYAVEALAYIVAIILTYCLSHKIYSKCFLEATAYKIDKVSFRTILGIFLYVTAYFIIEQQCLCEFYILHGGGIRAASDLETIPEILLISLSSVFLAPIWEEINFRYMCLAVYKSTAGKIAALPRGRKGLI